jgi:hypothetical protein
MQNYDPSESLFPEMAKELAALCQGDLKNDFPEPDAVADAVLHALFAENPKARYLAVTDRRHAEFIMRSAIAELAELSEEGSRGTPLKESPREPTSAASDR